MRTEGKGWDRVMEQHVTSAITLLSTIKTASSGTDTTISPQVIECSAITPRPPLVVTPILHQSQLMLWPASHRTNCLSVGAHWVIDEARIMRF